MALKLLRSRSRHARARGRCKSAAAESEVVLLRTILLSSDAMSIYKRKVWRHEIGIAGMTQSQRICLIWLLMEA